MKRLLLSVTLGMPLVLSCSPQGGLKSRKVSLIVKSLADPFYVKLAEGAQAAAAEQNLDLVILGIESETHVEKQITLVENEIIKKVGVIIISPADSKALVGVLKKALDKGIDVVAVDTPLDSALLKERNMSVPFVGPDNKAAGEKAGQYLIQKLDGKGKVAVLTGVAGVLSGDERAQGFLDSCKAAPGVEVAAQKSANWRRKDAAEAVAGILEEHPDLKGVFAVNEAMTLGAIDGNKGAGKVGNVLVVGYGRSKDIDAVLAAGSLVATIDEHPRDMGRAAVVLAKKLLAGQDIPKETPTPWDIIEAAPRK